MKRTGNFASLVFPLFFHVTASEWETYAKHGNRSLEQIPQVIAETDNLFLCLAIKVDKREKIGLGSELVNSFFISSHFLFSRTK